ncbi:lipase family protein [Nocardia sp. NPDC058518]|uniref:lipase family protein n=1 Tax=Nocardia sp. NPDC058518 TaxID=3346534 RepID=UPI00364D95A6
MRSRVLGAVGALSIPLRAAIGIAAVGVGALLFFAPLRVQTVALVTGVGFALVGIAAALIPQTRGGVPLHARVLGGVLVVLGVAMALWPSAGAPGLAFLIGAALIVHGLLAAWQAVRGDGRGNAGRVGSVDRRITAGLTAVASITVGVVAFSWPVLTIVLFRFGVAAWFVFLGLQLLFTALLELRGHGDVNRRRHRTTRGWTRTIAAASALVIAVLLAYGSVRLLSGVPLPEPGTFYTAPANAPTEPGRLLRSEPLDQGVPDGARGWRILYTTTHPDGAAAVSSGTILAPEHPSDNLYPLLTVAHGTTGIAPKCAPSLAAAPFDDGAGTALQEMVTQHGWVAVTSDYIGLGTQGTHPYLVGEAEARNVLDASRAAREFDEISTTTDTVVWGHSQGGQAALWTGQIARGYAPELDVKGVAAFAPAADLFGLAESDKTEVGGKTISAYIATTWNRLYPELRLDEHLTPGSERGVEKIRDLCFNGKDALPALLRGSQIPNQVFPDRLLDGEFGAKLKRQTPVGPFPAPVLVAQGLADPLVKPALQQNWIDARCTAGEPIDYRTFPGLSHMSLVAADSPLTPQLVQWTLDRRSGTAPTPTCNAG